MLASSPFELCTLSKHRNCTVEIRSHDDSRFYRMESIMMVPKSGFLVQSDSLMALINGQTVTCIDVNDGSFRIQTELQVADPVTFFSFSKIDPGKFALCQDSKKSVHLINLATHCVIASQFLGKKVLQSCWPEKQLETGSNQVVLLLLDTDEILKVSFTSDGIVGASIFPVEKGTSNIACVNGKDLFALTGNGFDHWFFGESSLKLVDRIDKFPFYEKIDDIIVLSSYVLIVDKQHGIMVFQEKGLVPIINKSFDCCISQISVCGLDSVLVSLASGLNIRMKVPSFKVIYEWNQDSNFHIRNDSRFGRKVFISLDNLVLCISESQPIHRYLQLVQGACFDEAESLAQKFNQLDHEYVYKAKLESLAQSINNQEAFDEILLYLKKVSDQEWLLEYAQSCRPDSLAKAQALYNSLLFVPQIAKLSIALEVRSFINNGDESKFEKDAFLSDTFLDMTIKALSYVYDLSSLERIWKLFINYHHMSDIPADHVSFLKAVRLPDFISFIPGMISEFPNFSSELESWFVEKAEELEISQGESSNSIFLLTIYEREIYKRSCSIGLSHVFHSLKNDLTTILLLKESFGYTQITLGDVRSKSMTQIMHEVLDDSFYSDKFYEIVKTQLPEICSRFDLESNETLALTFLMRTMKDDPLKNSVDEPFWIPNVSQFFFETDFSESSKKELWKYLLKTCIVPIPVCISMILEESKFPDESDLSEMYRILKLKDQLAKEYGLDTIDLSNALQVKGLISIILNTVPNTPLKKALSDCNALSDFFPNLVTLKDTFTYLMKMACRKGYHSLIVEIMPLFDDLKSEVWYDCLKELVVWLLLTLQSMYDQVSNESESVSSQFSIDIVNENGWLFESFQFICENVVNSPAFIRIASVFKYNRVFGYKSWAEFSKAIARVCALALKYGVIVTLPLLQNESFRDYCVNDLMKRHKDFSELGKLLEIPKSQILVISAEEVLDGEFCSESSAALLDISNKCLRELGLTGTCKKINETVSFQLVQIIFKYVIQGVRRKTLTISGLSQLKEICFKCLEFVKDLESTIEIIDTLVIIESTLNSSDIGKYSELLEEKPGHTSISPEEIDNCHFDRGLILTSKDLFDLLVPYISIVWNLNNGRDKQKSHLDPYALSEYLLGNGHFIMSIHCFNLLHTCVRVRKSSVSSENCLAMTNKIVSTLVPKLIYSKHASGTDISLTVYMLNILSEEMGSKLFNSCFSGVSKLDYKRLLSVSLVGVACARSWKLTSMASDFDKMSKNCRWWITLGSLDITFEKEKFVENPPDLQYLKSIVSKLVKKVPIQSSLDFANDFNLPEDHVHFEYMRHIFLDLDDQKEVEKYYDSLELIKNVIPVVANKEKLIGVLTEIILPLIPAYEYSKINACLECVGIIDATNKVYTKGILLLQTLRDYRRLRPPSDVEIDLVLKYMNLKSSPIIDSKYHRTGLYEAGRHKLPFQILAREPWKVLSKELSVATLSRLLPLSVVLELDQDKLVVVCIENYLAGDLGTVEQQILLALIQKISNVDTFIRTCKYVSDKFPDYSSERKAVLECALQRLLKGNYEATMDANVSKLKEKVSNCEILFLLHKFGFYERFKHLVQEPLELVIQILENCCDHLFDEITSKGLKVVISKVEPLFSGICKRCGINFIKVKSYLLNQWLKSSDSVAKRVDSDLPSESVRLAESNCILRKVSVLVTVSGGFQKSIPEIFQGAVSQLQKICSSPADNGVLEKARSIHVILDVLPFLFGDSFAKYVENVLKPTMPMSLDDMHKLRERLCYQLDFESIGFDQVTISSQSSWDAIDKGGLCKTLILESKIRQSAKFLKLCIRIAKSYGIFDDNLCRAVCQQMEDLPKVIPWILDKNISLDNVANNVTIWSTVIKWIVSSRGNYELLLKCPFESWQLELDHVIGKDPIVLAFLCPTRLGPLETKHLLQFYLKIRPIGDLIDCILQDRMFGLLMRYDLYDCLNEEDDQGKRGVLIPAFVKFLGREPKRITLVRNYYKGTGNEKMLRVLDSLTL